MSIRRLGEFGLIERFRKAIKTDPSVIKGSGDDCAVMRFDKKHYMLFTCDMLIEGIDFTSKEDPFLVGRKAIAVSISDIASCCGLPRYCTVSMALPRRSKVLTADKLFKGMYDICRQYGINLVGGDLSRADKLIIDVSMLGFVEKNRLCLRSKAKKGDVIFVTGEFGGSIKGKHLRFIPRVDEARFLSERFKVNSMIDISDGLTQDLSHILKASSVGALIYEDLIPASKEARDLTDVLSSGEDFELLFTVSLKDAKKILKRHIVNFKPIGQIMEKKYGLRLIDKSGREKVLRENGYRHF